MLLHLRGDASSTPHSPRVTRTGGFRSSARASGQARGWERCSNAWHGLGSASGAQAQALQTLIMTQQVWKVWKCFNTRKRRGFSGVGGFGPGRSLMKLKQRKEIIIYQLRHVSHVDPRLGKSVRPNVILGRKIGPCSQRTPKPWLQQGPKMPRHICPFLCPPDD